MAVVVYHNRQRCLVGKLHILSVQMHPRPYPEDEASCHMESYMISSKVGQVLASVGMSTEICFIVEYMKRDMLHPEPQHNVSMCYCNDMQYLQPYVLRSAFLKLISIPVWQDTFAMNLLRMRRPSMFTEHSCSRG